MLTKLVEQISTEMNLNQQQSERVVDMVLTEVKVKLPNGFQRNFVAVMNGERDFGVMDNFGGVLGTESHGEQAEEGSWKDVNSWKQKINDRLKNLK